MRFEGEGLHRVEHIAVRIKSNFKMFFVNSNNNLG